MSDQSPPVRARVVAIVAADREGAIGAQNRLPWHLPEDLKRFRALTLGAPVIMGRKTHESIGRPLPGRLNLVISRNREFQSAGVEVHSSLAEALARAQLENPTSVWVIGGAEIYRQAFELGCLDEVELTEVDVTVEGADAYLPPDWRALFPVVSWGEWQTSATSGMRFRYVRYAQK